MLFKVFTKLGDIAISEKGKKPTTLINEKKSGYIPYINIEAFEKKVFNKYTDGYECRLCDEGDVLIVWDGSRSGLVGRAYKGAIGSTIAKIQIPYIKNEYLYYFLIGKYLILNTRVKGTGTPHVDPAILWNFDFPIISNVEQTRIVEKIEELFSDLDKATEDLKKIQEQLKIYRQAVLKAAFEGKLFNMGSFEYFPFSEICDINPPKQEIAELNDDLEVTFMPMSAVSKSGVILEKNIKKLKDVKKGYTFFKDGDILLAKITPCFENGKKTIAKELRNNIGFGSTEFHVLRPKESVISGWVYYGVSLEDFRNKAKLRMTGTAGQKRVPKRVIESYEIPVPSKSKQKQIVSEIESRFSVCDKLEETVQQSLEKIEYLRQSILKKAFEGKLVPQDTNDEPAEMLLERIRQEKVKFESNNKKRKKR
jgi:type I restriction enzyme S subunit